MKIVNGFKPFIIFTKKLHYDKWQGPEYASAEGATWKVFWKIDVVKFAVKILKKTYEEVHF